MKYFNIVLFIFLFHISLALLNIGDDFSNFQKAPDYSLINSTESQTRSFSATASDVSQGNDYIFAVGNFFQSIGFFISFFFTSLVDIPGMITLMLGGSSQAATIGYLMGSIIYLIYAGAIVQFIGNRSFKSMN